jgi:hypothetical protein
MAFPCFLGQRLDFLAPGLNSGALICGRVANRERGGIASKPFRTWLLVVCGMCNVAHLHGLAGKLGQQDIETLLDSNAMAREFIVG